MLAKLSGYCTKRKGRHPVIHQSFACVILSAPQETQRLYVFNFTCKNFYLVSRHWELTWPKAIENPDDQCSPVWPLERPVVGWGFLELHCTVLHHASSLWFLGVQHGSWGKFRVLSTKMDKATFSKCTRVSLCTTTYGPSETSITTFEASWLCHSSRIWSLEDTGTAMKTSHDASCIPLHYKVFRLWVRAIIP